MRKIACKTVCLIVVVLAFLCTQASTREAMSTNGGVYGNHNDEHPVSGIGEDLHGTFQSEIHSRKPSLNGVAGGLDTKSAKAFLKSFPRTSSATEDLDHGLDRDQ